MQNIVCLMLWQWFVTCDKLARHCHHTCFTQCIHQDTHTGHWGSHLVSDIRRRWVDPWRTKYPQFNLKAKKFWFAGLKLFHAVQTSGPAPCSVWNDKYTATKEKLYMWSKSWYSGHHTFRPYDWTMVSINAFDWLSKNACHTWLLYCYNSIAKA